MAKKKPDGFNLAARPQRLHAIAYATNQLHLRVPPDITPEHLVDPRFFALASRTMRAGDTIEVLCEDQSWWAKLLVLDATISTARVAILELVDVAKCQQTPTHGASGHKFEIRWKGPQIKFQVVRLSDGVEVGRASTKSEAQKMIEDRIQVEAL